ncbi:HNH endonuclease [bacterium]|nr:HNH endonuclease [bacterium]
MPTPTKIKKFYQSARWKKARWQKIHQVHGLCEECGNAGWEVHHIEPLTLANVDKPEIALGLDNLQLLCTKCHNSKRSEEKEIRSGLMFDSAGNLVKKE